MEMTELETLKDVINILEAECESGTRERLAACQKGTHIGSNVKNENNGNSSSPFSSFSLTQVLAAVSIVSLGYISREKR